MDAVYSGGKKKVPNTDSKTKNRFKQVSVSTLFKKDQVFRKKVMKEYQAWVDEFEEEVEAMVMGLDDTVGSVRSGPRKASTSDWQAQVAQEDYEKKKQVAASKKKVPKVVSPTKEDDDFLREMRKKKGKPPKKK